MKKICAAIVGLAASVVLAQAPGNMNIRGKVSKVSGMSFTLTANSGESVEVKEKQDFKVYDQVATDLSHVKDRSFIGVTTVKQADGKEHAIEIHIFPEELRGAGEGGRIVNRAMGAASESRMSNGTVSQSRMSNGTVSQNRMTNGGVVKTVGGTMQVKYAGGVTDVVVPADVKVTEFKAVSHTIAVGDAIAVTGMKASDGSIDADRVMLVRP